MEILNFFIHGNSLRISTNNSAIAASAKLLLRYFQVDSVNGSSCLSISFHGVPSRFDIPFVLSPEATCLGSCLDDSGTEKQDAIYQDQGRLILDYIKSRGCLLVIDQQNGHADGFFVKPDTMHTESRMFLIHLALRNILKGKGFYTLHATALEKHGRAVLISGMSGRGKTTAFLSLLRVGYRCLSDDHPLVHENGNGLEILPFQEKIDVTENTIEFFPELREARAHIHPGLRKPYFFIENVYPGGTSTSCRPGVILFPEVIKSRTSALEPVSGKHALDRLIRESFLPRGNEAAKQEFHILSRLVAQSSCYRLLFGQDVLALPGLIDPLLRSC